ncbi:TPA: hypothetical protein N0F65_004967 [Lagenidium giganteum]|uniref:Uncharacterized protein n=1 Tax=Lagenidium giganteum TaxID=4803 RepID=A0AAV2YJX6_9STRA|nr:TPA: hypothetical protein N0F65_004967 [Lagenidium giganteum]
MFRMHHSKPGVVECREGPFSQAVSFDSRLAIPRPPPNAEKLFDVFTKIVPYVPAQYKEDSLYKKPSIDEEKRAAKLKRMRADARKSREGPVAE